MDIRFLKGLTPNVGYLFPNQVTLSPTPSLDIISIGIGQIIRNNPIYIPVHGLNPPYQIKKVCQYGGSNDPIQPSEPPQSNNPGQSLNDSGQTIKENQESHDNDNLLKENSKKRAIDESVKASFQHPIIRTKTLQLSEKKKLNSKNFKFRIIE